MNPSEEKNTRTLSITRTFYFPLQQVWDAWTEVGKIASWWGPKGMKVEIEAQDFRVGGNWKYVMAMPDGNAFTSEGQYSEIIDLEKITTSADFKPMTTDVVLELLFEANGPTTHFTFNCIHPTEDYCKQQEQMGFYKGWGAAFDRLDAFLSI